MSDTIVENKEIPYETKFEDGSEITDYLAVGVAEGFEETNAKSDEEATRDTIKAWSYICGKDLWRTLQGYFGRSVHNLINEGVLDNSGKVNWDLVNERFL